MFARLLHGFITVARLNDEIAMRFEQVVKKFHVEFIVLNNHNFFLCRGLGQGNLSVELIGRRILLFRSS
jgi:hypothetical protein